MNTVQKKPLASTGLNDSGKILVVLDAAASPEQLEIREARLDSYLYLLDRHTVLPLGYSFTFEPLPFSSQLWTDVGLLRELDFVQSQSPSLAITNAGREWLEQRLRRAADRKQVADSIREHLSKYVAWDTRTLVGKIYYMATTG